MGLIEEEIQELRQLARDVLSGTIKPEQAAVQIGIYNQVAKRELIMLKAITLGAKFGEMAWKRLATKNIVSDTDAIRTGEELNEEIGN